MFTFDYLRPVYIWRLESKKNRYFIGSVFHLDDDVVLKAWKLEKLKILSHCIPMYMTKTQTFCTHPPTMCSWLRHKHVPGQWCEQTHLIISIGQILDLLWRLWSLEGPPNNWQEPEHIPCMIKDRHSNTSVKLWIKLCFGGEPLFSLVFIIITFTFNNRSSTHYYASV